MSTMAGILSMIGLLNQAMASRWAAPPDLSGGAWLFAQALAEWTIFLGPGLLAFLWIVGDRQDRRAAMAAGLAGLLALLVAATVSSLYFHPRPFMVGLAHNYLHHASDSSFPSDHATLLFALAFSLWIEPPARLHRAGQALLLLACAVGWSRVYLGAHYPLDIVGAGAIGLVCAALFATRAGGKIPDHATALCQWLCALPQQIGGSRRR